MAHKDYVYKVTMTNDDCLAKRAVVFHDERHLRFSQVQAVAEQHITSQTCPRCNENHPYGSYLVTEVERGEPDGRGGYFYRDVLPQSSRDRKQFQFEFTF